MMKQKTKKIINRIITAILFTIMGFLMLFVGFAFLSRAMAKEGKPWLFGIGFYQIITGSMEPEIAVGDVVIAKAVSKSDLKVGDNIVFKWQNKIVTHKLIAINSDNTVTTHGVANSPGANETVNTSDILAKQIAVIPKLGNFINFLRSPFGFVIFIFAPLGCLIVYYTFGLTKQLKELKGEDKTTLELKDEVERLKKLLQEKTPEIPKENTAENSPISKENIPENLPISKENIPEKQPENNEIKTAILSEETPENNEIKTAILSEQQPEDFDKTSEQK